MTKYIEEQKRKYRLAGKCRKVLISVWLPTKLRQEIKQIATDHDMMQSEFIRAALANEVERWQA